MASLSLKDVHLVEEKHLKIDNTNAFYAISSFPSMEFSYAETKIIKDVVKTVQGLNISLNIYKIKWPEQQYL